MVIDAKLRNLLIRRIRKIPSDKLIEISAFLQRYDESDSKKESIMSFASAWNIAESDVSEQFTDYLISNRERSKRRYE